MHLESLDGRILPDATPLTPPDIPPTQATVPTVAVTEVVVIPVTQEDGTPPNLSIVLERAGSDCGVTDCDTASKSFYSGTDSVDTAIHLSATPAPDALMAQFGSSGNINTLVATESGLDNYSDPLFPTRNPNYPYQPNGLQPYPPTTAAPPGSVTVLLPVNTGMMPAIKQIPGTGFDPPQIIIVQVPNPYFPAASGPSGGVTAGGGSLIFPQESGLTPLPPNNYIPTPGGGIRVQPIPPRGPGINPQTPPAIPTPGQFGPPGG